MAHLKAALVLTWDKSIARVLCPFNCDAEIHVHGCTMPKSDHANSRLAHCMMGVEDVSYALSHYRLLFPFEHDPLTNGLWWEVDREECRWRTIGWGIDDPEYTEPDEKKPSLSESQLERKKHQDEDDGLEDAFEALHIQRPNHDKETLFFISFCVTNDVENVRRMLKRSEEPSRLVDSVCRSDKKPILLATCEEGHIETAELLLEYKPCLEAEDENGETALTRAVQYGWGRIALALVLAGANMDVIGSDAASLLKTARHSLKLQEEHRDFELHLLFEDDSATPRRLKNRALEITALETLIQQLEVREAMKCAEREIRKLVELHGEEQAEHFVKTRTFDQTEIIAKILEKIFATPTSDAKKTVACMTRGTSLPYTFAVSGWTPGTFGYCDGALNRPIWVDRVFQIAHLIDHQLPSSPDVDGRRGSFYACHVEKQLIAFMLWNHSSILISDPSDRADLKQCEPPSLASLPVDIIIWRSDKEASVCDDCTAFCEKVAHTFGMNLSLSIARSTGVEHVQSWNRATTEE